MFNQPSLLNFNELYLIQWIFNYTLETKNDSSLIKSVSKILLTACVRIFRLVRNLVYIFTRMNTAFLIYPRFELCKNVTLCVDLTIYLLLRHLHELHKKDRIHTMY